MRKTHIQGRPVYNFHFQEVGKIANTHYDESLKTRVYEVILEDEELKITFPVEQFLICEDGKACLMPLWLFNIYTYCSKIQKLEKQYKSLNQVKESISKERYYPHLIQILKASLEEGSKIIEPLTKLEEHSISLKKEQDEVIEETSRLMALRLLESGKKDSRKQLLPKKEYSLNIIGLRRKYSELSRIDQFVKDIFEKTKASMKFVNEMIIQGKDSGLKEYRKQVTETHAKLREVIKLINRKP